ncbi:DUF937 domain-containing protein [Rhizobium sp. KVB221]|uniref:DUF937 domain-containing protein n=1 Tax=Rhizobium setariae TaxID=2801340 RepID=A0A936YTX6_9HYPH|nr:YidB family protein [Rhizobium setariae]MBL0372762.1 DUF937 domain-containing protein [Rhizobium setariae]
MGMFDDAVPGGNITKPIMIALGALLVGKVLGGFGQGADAQAPEQPQQAPTADDGGLAGGLGGLLEKLGSAGHGKTADSWVRPGQNDPIAPGQLGDALGSQTISDLARRAGVSETELLEQLSRVLPGVVDKLTPQGQVPDRQTLDSFFRSALGS